MMATLAHVIWVMDARVIAVMSGIATLPMRIPALARLPIFVIVKVGTFIRRLSVQI
jgi:hypothetical protein